MQEIGSSTKADETLLKKIDKRIFIRRSEFTLGAKMKKNDE